MNKEKGKAIKASQNQMILSHLQSGKKLTKLEALQLFNCWSLSSRISDLNKMGHKIHSETVRIKSGKHIAEYSLI